ncbi:hypothetical protein EMIHUDRAFT_211345 [Emiliania huxleyi CCMP1516]|uniref:Uncharacterized protein n=2 Tax=Emiliania huxleyi TaxID=2903 RepID=A0A0D3IWU1_EMIH1|nr:hypothetical protein EMIHUDRAFT_211345 [Emiliania huxleyi CCMP1516]EOD15726.1 hypothetical protein EMIHUDRAFT_211345 [Emiliania huxleyi CCMP1516]|eukprot:XP_005768155.1 hypothetical protein EMIHUDRAFT_211345 [Emiliania huxleyi CCMP1516]
MSRVPARQGWCQGQLNCQGWCQGQINCLAGDGQVVDVVRRRLRRPRASAPRSKKSALYQEVPKPQYLHEVSVVRFAAACRRCADWLPVRIVLRGANAATRGYPLAALGSEDWCNPFGEGRPKNADFWERIFLEVHLQALINEKPRAAPRRALTGNSSEPKQRRDADPRPHADCLLACST